MEIREMQVEERGELGTGLVRKLRNQGKIPAVVYSESFPATSITLDDHSYHLSVRGCGTTQIFKLKSSNSKLNGINTFIKNVQVEPLAGKILHVDFLALSAGHTVTISVPVRVIGESIAVKESRAILSQTSYEIEVECLPESIPDSVEIDISGLDEGDAAHAKDIKLGAGVKLRSAPGLTIAMAISKKAAEAAADAALKSTAGVQPVVVGATDAASTGAAAPAAAAKAPAAKSGGKK